MAEVASIARTTQIGPESTPGTAVAALNRLRSLGIQLAIQAEVQTFKPDGSLLIGTSAIGKEWTGITLSGKPSYDELGIVFDSVIKKAAPSSLGGAPVAYRRLWQFTASTDDDPQTYSLEKGSRVRAMKAAYGLFTEAALAISRSSIDLTGAGMAQVTTDGVQMSTNEVQQVAITGSPTGGTFTLTYSGQTTSAIAYNAAAATVQSALEALSNIGSGNVVCTGGALPGTPVLVEFRAALRQTNVAQMTANSGSLTGGSSPTVTVTTTVPGVAPTALNLVPILPKQVGFFMDDTSAGLGTTRMTRNLAANYSFSGRYGPVWPLDDTQASYAAHVLTDPTFEFKITAAANAANAGLLDALRLGSTKYIRCRATGPLISGSNYNRLTMDAAVQVTAAPNPNDTEGLYTYEWTLSPIDDPTYAKGFEIELINQLAALA